MFLKKRYSQNVNIRHRNFIFQKMIEIFALIKCQIWFTFTRKILLNVIESFRSSFFNGYYCKKYKRKTFCIKSSNLVLWHVIIQDILKYYKGIFLWNRYITYFAFTITSQHTWYAYVAYYMHQNILYSRLTYYIVC